jgi:hypothetical protein
MTIRYQWQYFDVPQNKWLNIANNDIYSGAKTSVLNIIANNSLDNISYRCAILANCPPLAISGVAVLDVVDCGLRGASALVDADFITEVYPNPADNSTTIQFNNSSASHTLTLNNMLGKQILKASNVRGSYVIERGNLASGIYFVQITDSKGQTSTQKLTFR